MIGITVAVLSELLPLLHLHLSKQPRTRSRVIHLLLLYALVLDVGVGLFLGFIPHVFFADQAARLIGWPTGCPFEFEVGFHDGAWGLLGFLCLRIGGPFRLATGLGWSFLMFGATYIHIDQTVHEGNYAPYNFLTMFSDGFITVWLLILLYLCHRWVGFQGPGVAST
jgi:hypothetical protein